MLTDCSPCLYAEINHVFVPFLQLHFIPCAYLLQLSPMELRLTNTLRAGFILIILHSTCKMKKRLYHLKQLFDPHIQRQNCAATHCSSSLMHTSVCLLVGPQRTLEHVTVEHGNFQFCLHCSDEKINNSVNQSKISFPVVHSVNRKPKRP